MAYQKNIANDYKPEGLEMVELVITNVDQMREGHLTIMSSNLVLSLLNNGTTTNLQNAINALAVRIETIEETFSNLQQVP